MAVVAGAEAPIECLEFNDALVCGVACGIRICCDSGLRAERIKQFGEEALDEAFQRRDAGAEDGCVGFDATPNHG